MVNGVDIYDAFQWIHSIANATDFEDFIKVILGSVCLHDRHRAKRFVNFLFSDFVIRRLGVVFLNQFTPSEVAKGIVKEKDEDINADTIDSMIMNEVIEDKIIEEDIWDF